MEIQVTKIATPMFNEFTVFEPLNLNHAIEDGFITVTASKNTKTRVHTNVKVRKAQYGVNWKIDGFKTHEKKVRNMWSYSEETHNYFMVSKSQSYDEYLEYVKAIVLRLFKNYGLENHALKMQVKFIDRFNNWK